MYDNIKKLSDGIIYLQKLSKAIINAEQSFNNLITHGINNMQFSFEAALTLIKHIDSHGFKVIYRRNDDGYMYCLFFTMKVWIERCILA